MHGPADAKWSVHEKAVFDLYCTGADTQWQALVTALSYSKTIKQCKERFSRRTAKPALTKEHAERTVGDADSDDNSDEATIWSFADNGSVARAARHLRLGDDNADEGASTQQQQQQLCSASMAAAATTTTSDAIGTSTAAAIAVTARYTSGTGRARMSSKGKGKCIAAAPAAAAAATAATAAAAASSLLRHNNGDDSNSNDNDYDNCYESDTPEGDFSSEIARIRALQQADSQVAPMTPYDFSKERLAVGLFQLMTSHQSLPNDLFSFMSIAVSGNITLSRKLHQHQQHYTSTAAATPSTATADCSSYGELHDAQLHNYRQLLCRCCYRCIDSRSDLCSFHTHKGQYIALQDDVEEVHTEDINDDQADSKGTYFARIARCDSSSSGDVKGARRYSGMRIHKATGTVIPPAARSPVRSSSYTSIPN
eukprot:9868-Heterococcus_DN1.PRE.4